MIIGGSADDRLYDIATDAAGNVYAVGETFSADFPVLGGIQSTRNGIQDAFIVKLDPSGQLLYSTYLGGSGFDSARSVVVDGAGNAYVAGYTTSANFPLQSPLDANRGGLGDGFIAKLGPQGDVLLFSTYFGGNSEDSADAIAIDAQGNLHVAGRTSGGLATINAAQPTYGGNDDAFVLRLNAALDIYGYVSYLGGAQLDYANAIGVDGSGRACVAGFSGSVDFPRVNPSQPPPGSTATQDGFYALFAAGGNTLAISSLLGGTGPDMARGVACNATHLAVVGDTESIDFPTGVGSARPGQSAPTGVQSGAAGGRDAYVLVIRPSDGSRVYSTLRGGRRDDLYVDLLFGVAGELQAFGSTESSDLSDGSGAEVDLDGAGVFRSTDDGVTWQATGLHGMFINKLVTAPTVPPSLLAATDRGLQVSTNGGATWNVVAGDLPGRVVNSVIVAPTAPTNSSLPAGLNGCRWIVGVEYELDDDGIGAARTPDCGGTWEPWGEIGSGLKNIYALEFAPDRVVANVDRVSTNGDGTPSDTCVETGDGARVDCFGRGSSDNVIAPDVSVACGWYEADAFSGNVYRIGAGVAGCNVPFNSQGTGPPFTQPVTALAAVPAAGAETSRRFAATANGQVFFGSDDAPGTWSQVPVNAETPVTAFGVPSTGDLQFSAGVSLWAVSRDGTSADLVTDNTGATSFGDLEPCDGAGPCLAGTARGPMLLAGTFSAVDPAVFTQSARYGNCFQEPGAAADSGARRWLGSTLVGKCGSRGPTIFIGSSFKGRDARLYFYNRNTPRDVLLRDGFESQQ